VGDTKIEWAEMVWNPVTGCDPVSPGCTNCYAMQLVNTRLSKMRKHPRFGHPFDEVMLHPERLGDPSRITKSSRIFVVSMGDPFHVDVPDGFLDRMFEEMEGNPRHDFQLLTKRAERMKRYINKRYPDSASPCPEHIWVGVSVESMAQAWRSKMLCDTNATVRWISAEPLLDSLKDLDVTAIDWVVVGGESAWKGKRRDMKAEWVRELRDKCVAADTPFFFKQWGGPPNAKGGGTRAQIDGERWNFYPLVDAEQAKRWRERLQACHVARARAA
jgi:protein gp37